MNYVADPRTDKVFVHFPAINMHAETTMIAIIKTAARHAVR